MSLESLKSVQKTIGAKQTLKAIERGDVKTVFVALDSDERISAPILESCHIHDVPVNNEHTMDELGRACKIKVAAAAVGILR